MCAVDCQIISIIVIQKYSTENTLEYFTTVAKQKLQLLIKLNKNKICVFTTYLTIYIFQWIIIEFWYFNDLNKTITLTVGYNLIVWVYGKEI